MWLTPNNPNYNNNNSSSNIPYNNNNTELSSFSQTSTTSLFNDPATNLDIDSEIRSQSTTSSPQSTVGSVPLSTFDTLPASKIPRAVQNELFNFSTPTAHSQTLLPSVNMMYADSWLGDNSQFTPKSSSGRGVHNRDSSMSSLGSLGPASPFPFNASNPQIAVSDSNDCYHNLAMADDQSYQLATKAPISSTSHDTFYANYPYNSGSTSVQAYASMLAPQKHRGDGNSLLPPPDFPSGGSSNSRPASVASSVASDSPATPAAPERSEDEKRRKAGENFSVLTDFLNNLEEDPHSPIHFHPGLPTMPKLDRTMTDIYSDELYNPNFSISSASPSRPSQSTMSPTHEMFAQRVQAANNQHMNTTQSPMVSVSRGQSPFRQHSPLAPVSHDFSQPSANIRFNTAQQMREQRQAQQDAAQALRQTMAQPSNIATPQTISPKDALLEFNDTDNGNNFPLFPQSQSSGFDANQLSKATTQANNSFGALSLDTAFENYLNPQMSSNMQLPQQYPFVAKHRQQSSLPSISNGSFSMSSRVGSTPSVSPDTAATASPQRPENVGADAGTYTCTYHGCTQRFETPALLQKHKREGHRQAHGLNGLRRPEGPSTSYFNTQAGPHKCERINPSTGKPCHTIFSRPYDLTRHEDTIHNARKQKVRCDVCTEEKTFSRADALTRHYRVCHPDLEFPGKHRKRGVSSH